MSEVPMSPPQHPSKSGSNLRPTPCPQPRPQRTAMTSCFPLGHRHETASSRDRNSTFGIRVIVQGMRKETSPGRDKSEDADRLRAASVRIARVQPIITVTPHRSRRSRRAQAGSVDRHPADRSVKNGHERRRRRLIAVDFQKRQTHNRLNIARAGRRSPMCSIRFCAMMVRCPRS